MIYIIRPNKKWERNKQAWNKLYRRLFHGDLPKDHHKCDGVEIFDNDLDKAMNDIYKPRFSKGEPGQFLKGRKA